MSLSIDVQQQETARAVNAPPLRHKSAPNLVVPEFGHRRKQGLTSRLFSSSTSINTEDGRTHAHSAHASHVVKQLLNHIYGEIDWRKAPGDRNKIDYCARVLFPLAFALFVIAYFVVLHVVPN
jgi:hypothetical protein